MDITTFSPKLQTLISSPPLSSSSSSSSKFSSHFYVSTSFRTEFLGCNVHRVRITTGPQSRRRCRRLGFQLHSPRFIFRASLYTKSVIVIVIVAVATFAALGVVYFNYIRRKKDDSELSGPKDHEVRECLAFSEQARCARKQQDNEIPIVDFGVLYPESSLTESKSKYENMCCRKGRTSDQEEAQLLTREETLIANLSQQLGSEVLPSSISDTVCRKTTEVTLVEVFTLGAEKFSVDVPELLARGRQEEAGIDLEVTRIMVEPAFSGSAVPVMNTFMKFKLDSQLKNKMAEKGDLQVSSNKGLSREFDRELHTFYKEKESWVRSVSHFNGLSAASPNIPIQDNNHVSPIRFNNLHGTELSAKVSSHTAEFPKGQVPMASNKEGSASKRNESIKTRGFSRDMGRRLMHPKGDRDLSIFPQRIKMHHKDKNNSSGYYNIYNRWLRDGRLIDCIELLESMENKGLLDMDKIYHARFLKTCKSQKAVKEAFRFTRLIKKPTLSTFNMLLSVCASSQDSEGAFQVLILVKEARLKADCKLYTTLISTCAKSGKVDAMFEVFHEMVNSGVEPNVHTYGALIDGCARAGQVAKAFGAYGIMSSKKVKPDRVVFNALITACGQSGAVDRAFDVLAEMMAEPHPIDPDHVTVGALMKTCTKAGQVDRALEVYKMIHRYNIKGTPDVYTIAVSSCSMTGDLDFALCVYSDMTKNGVVPDEMFLSTLIDVAGHAGKLDIAFEILENAKIQGIQLGSVSYSSLMGACSNAKNWHKALELYEDIIAIKLCPTVSTLNALITSLCDGDQLHKAVEILAEIKEAGVFPNTITYSILFVACEKKDELEIGFKLFSQAKKDGVIPHLIMCKCLTGVCLRRFEKAYSLGEPILSFNSGKPQIENKWTSWALMVYRETIAAGVVPTMEAFSQVLGCLQIPRDTSVRKRLVENLGVGTDASTLSNIYSLLEGFGEYDLRSFSLLEEAASLGLIPGVSLKQSPIIVDVRKLQVHTAEVYLLTVLKGLKYRLAAGAKLPNITIILPIEKTDITYLNKVKIINLVGRVGQAVGALLRRLGLTYQGNESFGKIRISGLALKRWFQPKLSSPFSDKPAELSSTPARLAKGITDQQRSIRMSNLSLELSDQASITLYQEKS